MAASGRDLAPRSGSAGFRALIRRFHTADFGVLPLPVEIFRLISRGQLALVLMFCMGARASQAAAPATPIPRPPEEIPVREFLAGRVVTASYVFPNSRFPFLSFAPPAALDRFLGHHTQRTTFYDLSRHVATEPKAPGPYAAVVTFTPDRGRPTRRLVTLFHAPGGFPFGQRLDTAHLDPIAHWTGLSPDQLQRNVELLQTYCQNQPLEALAQNPGMARIFAGIARMVEDKQPVRKNSDAFAWERQWWVEIKRQISGADQQWPGPFVAPRKLQGQSAPTVREGSLAEAGMQPDATDKLDAICRQWAADSDQGFAVCVARHGVIVLHKAYGMRDGQPMTVTSKSWMASVTKCFSATCMMMVVDQGLVSLDDPIDKFLPQFRGLAAAKPMTIRHLYTHTSGLADWPSWGDDQSDVEDQLADCYGFVKVGAEWKYGGQGNTLGCKILEAISGDALPLFYLHHVLGPLGMDHTDVLGAHADMQTAPLDIARFAQMLLNRGRYGDMEFMRPETFEQMLPQKLTKTLGPDAAKAFGIGMDGTPGSGKFGHGAASAATFSIDQNDDLVIIVCRNAQGKNWDKYQGKFVDAVHAAVVKGP